MFETVINYSKKIDNGRTRQSVLAAVMSEVGELAEEVNISEGMSYKTPGPDGVFGEAIDVIAATADLIYVDNPNITPEEVHEQLLRKLDKWLMKTTENDS